MATLITGSGVDKVIDGSITSTKIADGTITNADINASAAIARSKVDGSFGKVLQVVEAQAQSSTTNPSTSYADVNGTSISITPSSTSSRILIMWNCGGMGSGNNHSIRFKVFRGSTVVRYISRYGYSSPSSGWDSIPISIQYLDSPSTTSEVTYKLQCATETNNDFRINDTPSTDDMVVIAMEIGG